MYGIKFFFCDIYLQSQYSGLVNSGHNAHCKCVDPVGTSNETSHAVGVASATAPKALSREFKKIIKKCKCVCVCV